MNFASLEQDDENYFETLRGIMEPVLVKSVEPHAFHSNLVQFKQSYVELNEKIRVAEENIQKFESDLRVLSDAGDRLVSSEMKLRLRELCEDYVATHELQKIRDSIGELYMKQREHVKALEPIMNHFENLTCPVCFESQVYMYNDSCGHTLCVDCSQKSKRCPMCRALTNYKPLVYNG